MKRETYSHPKLFSLMGRLQVGRATAIGHLALLWDFAAIHATGGDIGKWDDGAIARACDWTGSTDAFIEALVDSGWVDRSPACRLVIHDWQEHCERWVKLRAEKMKVVFAASVERSTEASIEALTEASVRRPLPLPLPLPLTPTLNPAPVGEVSPTTPRARFVKPTLQEVQRYCSERNNGIDAGAFIDHYESNGWRVGKSTMKDWRAAVRTWERNRKANEKPTGCGRPATKEEIALIREIGLDEWHRRQGNL